MTAHKHASMIKAKADNMDLVVFIKCTSGWQVQVCNEDQLNFSEGHEYFLCLPKHNENGQCLHWLNGGKVQNNIAIGLPSDSWIPFCDFDSDSCEPWSAHCNFMRKESNFRIKPRKEKRWIVAKPRALASMMYFESEEQAQSTVRYSTGEYKGGQVIEIEIEI